MDNRLVKAKKQVATQWMFLVFSLFLVATVVISTSRAQDGPRFVPCIDTLALNSTSVFVGSLTEVHDSGQVVASVSEPLKGLRNTQPVTLQTHGYPTGVLRQWMTNHNSLLIFDGLAIDPPNPEFEAVGLLTNLINLSDFHGEVITEQMRILGDPREILATVRRTIKNSPGSYGPRAFPRSLPSGWASEGKPITAVPIDPYLERWAGSSLESTDGGKRKEAAEALGYFPSEANSTRLQALLNDSAVIVNGTTQIYYVRRAAYESLVRIRVRVVRPVLEKPITK